METASESVDNPGKLALNNALIWSVVNITIFLISYYVALIDSFVWNGVQTIIGIGLAIYFCMDIRKKIGGYWSFRQALSSIFLMFFIQGAIVFLFTIIFAKIEPGYVLKMKEISMNAVQLLEKIGMNQDEIDKAVAASESEIEKKLNPGVPQFFIGLATIALMYFIGALIFAAIFKKDPPIFLQKTEE